MTILRRPIALALGGALLCGAATVAAQNLEARDAWIRAMPPVSSVSSAYVTLVNTSDKTIVLVGAETPVAGTTEIHTHVHSEGMARMRRLRSLEIGAGKAARFKPGGHHLMLMNLQKPLSPGDRIPITLKFADRAPLQVEATVR